MHIIYIYYILYIYIYDPIILYAPSEYLSTFRPWHYFEGNVGRYSMEHMGYNRYRYGNEPVMDYLSLGMVISRANCLFTRGRWENQ